MNAASKADQMFTIGALSRATGVPPDTLRTWERRYGFPKPERTDTGHRRYSQETVERLRLVREALQYGHRAANVIHSEIEALRSLVDEARPNADEGDSEPLVTIRVIERWIDLVRRFDGRGFERELRSSLAALGVPSFLSMRAAPFIKTLGDRWADGLIGVRHEHFASERLSEFFIRQWRPLSDACSGPAVVCATPAGERHALGLQMAAFTLALNNLRVVYLGADLPANEIAEAVTQHAARAVVLSAAQGADVGRLQTECTVLRSALGDDFPIVAGGAGFREITAVSVLEDLHALNEWAASLCASVV
jgi:DNA-binding transcriptional MerR regulator